MMQAVCALSNRAFNDRFVLSDTRLHDIAADTVSLIQKVQPTSLMLAEARLSPDVLAHVLPALVTSPPAQLFLYGRLLEAWHDRLDQLSDLLSELGYQPDYSFDPNICRGFSHADALAKAGRDGPE